MLRQIHLNRLSHGSHRRGQIGTQQRLGLNFADALTTVHLRTCVSITDGPDTGGILVGREPEPFEAAREGQSRIAVVVLVHASGAPPLRELWVCWRLNRYGWPAHRIPFGHAAVKGEGAQRRRKLKCVPCTRVQSPNEWSGFPWQQRQPMTSRSLAE